ncbi:Glycosyl transferase, family II [Desulfonema limicola]|uniref:Glycosyl transferase, family II n=1 Tax=Desulfonema limicola TaxID=45656 RepID=A0A975GGK2_9BACT|nr:glycosyltransferase [Desulfonema limicola]QTA80415.1 Glycosyl transferase, family II [Desulfonema limicola]
MTDNFFLNNLRIDVFIVVYKPDFELFRRQLESIISQSKTLFNLYVWDNNEDIMVSNQLESICNEYSKDFISNRILGKGKNLGFGIGHNNLMEISYSYWILILNQEVLLEPECIDSLIEFAKTDTKSCAWEMRQIPYEHPKMYDPVTLETPWVSCAACLFRRSAFEKVRGFDPHIFMYGEDVDISWRLRYAGWKLRYIPKSAVIHNTYDFPGEIKPLQVIGGTLTNLCLRARFGNYIDIIKGILMLIIEISMPESFPGRRKMLIKNLSKFYNDFSYFRDKSDINRKKFAPAFSGWNYSLHREGAFYKFKKNMSQTYPLVSILIRTSGRTEWLREALLSVRNQTYPNIETIVVEDGPPLSEKMISNEFLPLMNIRYYSTGKKIGRSAAGNIALDRANGDYFNFLDDDDVLFADHVQVLIQTVTEHNKKGAYSLAWETPIRIISDNPLKYKEETYYIRHRQSFSRIALWHENYMPIQSVLFCRSLYEKYGGFFEDMEQLEDWNLWTRYTLDNDFCFVEKCTSKYRIFSDFNIQKKRQKKLDQAYRKALEKQKEMLFTTDPRTISELIEDYIHKQAIFCLTHIQLRYFAKKTFFGRQIISCRGYFQHILIWLKKRLNG